MSKPTDMPDRELDRLYAAAPDRFVETRKELAQALRDSGRDKEAAYVRSLRKPTVAASAINRAVHANRHQVSDVIAAARELRRAHARAMEKGGGDRRFLRDAATQERDAVTAMADKAAETLERDGATPSADVLRRIRETLDAVALDDEVMERFSRGRLEREARAAGLSLPAEGPSKRAPDRTADRAAARKAREAERELGSARRAVETKQGAVERARAQRDRADAAMNKADRELRAARAALERAERKAARSKR